MAINHILGLSFMGAIVAFQACLYVKMVRERRQEERREKQEKAAGKSCDELKHTTIPDIY